MKKHIVLLGVVASLAMPFTAGADTPSTAATGPSKKAVKKAPAVAVASDRNVFYITSRTAVGSHIPLVVSRYHGQYTSLSPGTAYGRNELDRTGRYSVAGELYQTDPAISSVSVRR